MGRFDISIKSPNNDRSVVDELLQAPKKDPVVNKSIPSNVAKFDCVETWISYEVAPPEVLHTKSGVVVISVAVSAGEDKAGAAGALAPPTVRNCRMNDHGLDPAAFFALTRQ